MPFALVEKKTNRSSGAAPATRWVVLFRKGKVYLRLPFHLQLSWSYWFYLLIRGSLLLSCRQMEVQVGFTDQGSGVVGSRWVFYETLVFSKIKIVRDDEDHLGFFLPRIPNSCTLYVPLILLEGSLYLHVAAVGFSWAGRQFGVPAMCYVSCFARQASGPLQHVILDSLPRPFKASKK